MRNKLITSILIFMSVILLGASVLILRKEDRTAPVIEVGKSAITYKEGEDYDQLLEGVVAEDNKDGDVTDKIFVDKIVKSGDGKKAIVKYAVIDQAKNVGTAERKVTYEENKKEEIKMHPEEKKEEEVTETSEQQDKGMPVIRLKSSTVTVKKGSRFSALSYVDTVEDNQDNKSDLYKRIHIDGKYNINVQGTYVLQYYVRDHEGNMSNIEKLTLIVQ
ncbi:immunoglobulin-like domain-containing protein [Faecalimonas sp.]